MKRYLIKKGAMRSGLHFGPVFFPETVSFKFMFDESALCMNGVDQINKLAGLSFCLDHHKNSARVGWMVADGQVCLYAYWYSEGLRYSKWLGVARIGVSYEGFVSRDCISVSGMETLEIDLIDGSFIGYVLYPYVGGTIAALKDVSIGLKFL